MDVLPLPKDCMDARCPRARHNVCSNASAATANQALCSGSSSAAGHHCANRASFLEHLAKTVRPIHWGVVIAAGAGKLPGMYPQQACIHQARQADGSLVGSCSSAAALAAALLVSHKYQSSHKAPTGCCRFFWIDPVAYAQKALVINEFAAPRWQSVFVTNVQTGVTQSVGDAVLGQRDLPTQQFWIWVGVAVLAGTAVIFNLLTWFFHAVLGRKPPPPLSQPREDTVLSSTSMTCFYLPACCFGGAKS